MDVIEVVGMAQLSLPLVDNQHAGPADFFVHPGHRLGLAVKLANQLAVQQHLCADVRYSPGRRPST